jgi:RNA recognition motif-containing protein
MKDIFVGNLDYGTSEDELRQLFAAYGPVDLVSIVTDRYSGQPRGSAFVEMASARDADKAITELNVLNSTAASWVSMRRVAGQGAPTRAGQAENAAEAADVGNHLGLPPTIDPESLCSCQNVISGS